MTKTDRRHHALIRAEQRYGLILQNADLDFIIEEIKDKKSMCLDTTGRSEVHLMRYGGKAILPAYNPAKNAILTFLPEKTLEDMGHRPRKSRKKKSKRKKGD